MDLKKAVKYGRSYQKQLLVLLLAATLGLLFLDWWVLSRAHCDMREARDKRLAEAKMAAYKGKAMKTMICVQIARPDFIKEI